MVKLKTFSIICTALILSFSLLLSSCGGEAERTLVPSLENWEPGEPVAGDSVLLFESGPSYVGNTAYDNPNNYPAVEISRAVLTVGTTHLNLSYRAEVESPRGERRYHIITMFLTGKDLKTDKPQNAIAAINLYTKSVPEGLIVSEGTQWTGGLSSGSVLIMDVTENVSTGKHKFDIGFLVNGIDFGTLPCTLIVSK